MTWLSDFAQWLLDVALWLPRWLWNELLHALAALVQAIPVPDAVAAWAASAGSLAPGVVWFLDLLQFRAGLGMVFGAYVARWILRRIPLIG